MSEEELKEFVPKVSVYARVSPEHKIRIVRAWQEKGRPGGHDRRRRQRRPRPEAGGHRRGMGITGTEVAKDAAAMVLTDDNFATIVQAVKNGRNVYANIRRSIQFLLSGNTAGILTVLYASLMALPVPFAASTCCLSTCSPTPSPPSPWGWSPTTTGSCTTSPVPGARASSPSPSSSAWGWRGWSSQRLPSSPSTWASTTAARRQGPPWPSPPCACPGCSTALTARRQNR